MWAVTVGIVAFTPPQSLQETALGRRAALVGGASIAAFFAPSGAALADTAVPTFSLKGVPGLSSNVDGFGDAGTVTEGSKGGFSLQGVLGGGPSTPPTDLGVIGRGTNKDKTGRLNKCENGKKGCISTFDDPDVESYVPPWTYQPGFSTQAISPNDARREALRAQAGLEANGGVAPPPKPQKSKEAAYEELKVAIAANNGVIVEEGDRYVRCEFAEGNNVDDVEFLISLDLPIVNYRSAARRGGDDKRQRNRIKEIRKSLKDQGWKSVGRQLEGV